MEIGFNSNNKELNTFLKEQNGKPVTDEIKTKAIELAKKTKGGEKQTGLKNISSEEIKDIENYLKIDILDKKELNALGKARIIDLGLDNNDIPSNKTALRDGEKITVLPPKQVNPYLEKFGNYNKQKNWDPSLLANSVSSQKELVELSKESAKLYNVPNTYLLAAFAIETDPADHDIITNPHHEFFSEDYMEEFGEEGFHSGFKYISEDELLTDDEYNSENEESGVFPRERDFPVSGFLVGGIDDESWLKGLPFKKGTDYIIREEINEHGKSVRTPNFKDGKTCAKAFMMVFGREAGKYYEMAEKENWKNFDPEAPFVLARLAYNAGSKSKGFKKALDFYKNGEGKELPHVQPHTNVEKNLEHALKILDNLKTKPGFDTKRPL